ncbi:MAG: 1-deoxy-D-xylulose-5-phosphate synthase [Hyphomonadaceae bacterium]|nr:1-deoxy-D-xylulose-5-phosphate synthase [Clostridia bacterium]
MDELINGVHAPDDLKKLNYIQLAQLAQEIRAFLVESVSQTGGHLASNLGVVELTIAMHYVLNSPTDKIVWDVGHQAYVHKILTGRKDLFHTLRMFNGLSGFPKCSESVHDIIDTGHSSTSISVALGLAKARDLSRQEHAVVAVIGDGAMTGGMAFEALNDAGRTEKSNFMIILNDNAMSIGKNVGGMSTYLDHIRTGNWYFWVKQTTDKVLNNIPFIGHWLALAAFRMKNTIKYIMFPETIFDELGVRYMGPYDGHDIRTLVNIFRIAKSFKGPVLVHLITKKGKGYSFAEQDPDIFHGISKFDIDTGETCAVKGSCDYSAVFGQTLLKLAKQDEKIIAISAAMVDGTGLRAYAEQFPTRFFDVGIAEQHAVTFSAGLAQGGFKPVFAVYSSFLQRAYDQIIHDVALTNANVVFAIDRAGIVGQDGETHQGIFDLSFLNHIPNLTIMAPACYTELTNMLTYALTEHKGPVAIRYPRGIERRSIPFAQTPIRLGEGYTVTEGSDVTLIAIGSMVAFACTAAENLKKHGISVQVVNARFLKPMDEKLLLNAITKTKTVISIEDNVIDGGLATNVASLILKHRLQHIKFIAKGFPTTFIQHGNVDTLYKLYRLDPESLASDILEELQPIERKN